MPDSLPAPVAEIIAPIAEVIQSGIEKVADVIAPTVPIPSPTPLVIPRSEIPGDKPNYIILGILLVSLAVGGYILYKRMQAKKPATPAKI